MAPREDTDQHVKGGPANHAAGTGLDAPTPPGGPLRQDAPDADVHPSGRVDPAEPADTSDPAAPQPEPEVHPSSTPGGPSTIPTPSTPEGEPGPDPQKRDHNGADATSEAGRRLQAENAETSLDQPSDGSGGE